jgi:hypothetical protein
VTIRALAPFRPSARFRVLTRLRVPAPLAAGAPWVVAIGGAIAAWFLPSSRSAVVLNLIAVLAALYLGVRAYRISVLQAEQTARTIMLSRQPLLSAVHEPAGWPSGSVKDAWYPAEQPYLIGEDPAEPIATSVALAFTVLVEMTRKGERIDRALVYLRNVGEGPAMITAARLWSGLGLAGSLRGSASVGAGGVEAFSCELRQDPSIEVMADTAARWATDPREAAALRAEWESRKSERLYFLEVSYHDIFGPATGQSVLRSWFDSSGRGQWRALGLLAYPPESPAPAKLPDGLTGSAGIVSPAVAPSSRKSRK